MLKRQETVLGIYSGPQGTARKPNNNQPASLCTPVRCSAPQQRRSKIHISSFKKAGEILPHHLCEEKGCVSVSKLNGSMMLLGAEHSEHGVACVYANDFLSLQRVQKHLSHCAVMESCLLGGTWQA